MNIDVVVCILNLSINLIKETVMILLDTLIGWVVAFIIIRWLCKQCIEWFRNTSVMTNYRHSQIKRKLRRVRGESKYGFEKNK